MAEREGFEDFSKSGNVENQGRSGVPLTVYPETICCLRPTSMELFPKTEFVVNRHIYLFILLN
jgi:hypothetical protein